MPQNNEYIRFKFGPGRPSFWPIPDPPWPQLQVPSWKAPGADGGIEVNIGQEKEQKKDKQNLNNYGLWNMGVSENSVPLNPMVNDHYPY